MKKILSICLLTAFLIVYSSFKTEAQLNQVFVEATVHDGSIEALVGHTTYRLYAQNESPGDQVIEITGDPVVCAAHVSTTTEFFRNTIFLDGVTGQDMNCGLFGIPGFEDLRWSSFVTIGFNSSCSLGIPFSENPVGDIPFNSTGEVITVGSFDTSFSAGGNIDFSASPGGAWFSIPGSANTLGVGVNNSVLIGQFTTNGQFSYDINVSVIPDGQEFETYTHCFDDTEGLSYVSIASGCMDSQACNYSATAEIDNGNCLYVADTCNDGLWATVNDVYDENCNCSGVSTGCTDSQACNYDEFAIIDNGECVLVGDSCNDGLWDTINDIYDENCNCSGVSTGCTDSQACNYDEFAVIDNGECISIGDSCNDGITDTNNDVYNSNCDCVGTLTGCTASDALNFNSNAQTDDGSCVIPSCSDAPMTLAYCYAEDESSSWVLTENTPGGGVTIYFQQGTLETGWDYMDILDADNNVIASVDGDLSGLAFSTNTESLTINIISDLSISCASGSQTPIEMDYYCSTLELGGCTDPQACNYNSAATSDNGTCILIGSSCDDFNSTTVNDVIESDCSCQGDSSGCTDSSACNFDMFAEIEDGSCQFPGSSCDDLNPETSNDTLQEDCLCVGSDGGCTDNAAVNYDELAEEDDGSCCYSHSIEVILMDSFGDGGPSFNLFDSNNVLFSEGTMVNGFGPSSFSSCIETPSCFIFELIPDVFEGEISAQILIDGQLVFTHSEGDSYAQYPFVVNVGDNPDCVINGCTDSSACNYSGLATSDDGTCDYDFCVGCSNPGAVNYSDLVTQDDGTCEWGVTGVVFIDDNFNGVQDPFEAPLPYQQVALEPGGIVVITDDNGEFTFSGLDEGEYVVTVNYTAEWSNYTTDISQTYVFPNQLLQTTYFGVTNEAVPAPSACVDFYQWGFGVPCNDELNFNICYRNMSPYPISGVVEVELDPLVSYSWSYPSDVTIDGNTISWDFVDLGSWVMNFDDIVINTPDETHIGEFMTNSVTIYAWWEGELVPITDQIITQEVTCAYDPNDITGIPEGYTEDHFVLPDTRMEYLVRFQNTGNAPAGTVTVVDTLDMDMDWSSFELIANSHSVMTTIDQESGRVEFLFEEINLPDSIANEPESHGMVSFKIDFADGTPIGEEINQTAHIFFDNNPAVVTNTTWHTIHECGGEGDFTATAIEVCAGEEITFTSTYPHVEDYQWNVDAAPAGNEENYTETFSEAGDYIVQLVSENPICNDATSQMITVYELPEAEITENGALLTASEGASYQWYQNGEAIYNGTSQTYEAVEDGNYHVVVTNENDCSMESAGVIIVNVSELTEATILLYPNPMTSVATLEIDSPEKKTIELIDGQGKVVRSWESVTDQRIEIQRGELSSGTYFVNVLLANNQKKVMVLVVK